MTERLFEELQAGLSRDTAAFAPELLVCAGIVLLLALRLFRIFDRHHLSWVALVLALGALAMTWMQWAGIGYDPREPGVTSIDLFTGLLVFDNFAIFIKLFLFGFLALAIFLSL